MSFKNGLVGLILGGALAFGSGEKARGVDYIETFDSPASLNNWVLSDSSKFQQTTFQGDGVLRFEQGQSDYAFIPIQRQRGKPFTLEWDSFVVTPNFYNEPSRTRIADVFRFGLFSAIWPGGSPDFREDKDAILAGMDLGLFSPTSTSTPLNYFSGLQALPLRTLWTQSGGQTGNLYGMWIHNVLRYDTDNVSPFDSHLHLPFTLTSPFGKGNKDTSGINAVNLYTSMRDDTIDSIDFDSYEPFIENFKANNVGFYPAIYRPHNYVSFGFMDNIEFTEIPEPSTSLLLGIGIGLSGVLASRKKG